MPKVSGWDNLIRHARSHIGAVLVIAIILLAILIATLYAPIPTVAKLIVLPVIVIIIMIFGIWVMVRTPKTPEGLVATEDYYALELYLKHFKGFGIESEANTKKDILKKKLTGKDVLPPLKTPKQLEKGKD